MPTHAHHDGTTVVEDHPRSPQRASADLVYINDRGSQIRATAAIITAAVLLVAVIVLATTAIITATIAATTPQGGQVLITLRGTHPITAVPAGEHITISADKRDMSLGGRVTGVWGIGQTSTVVVLAGPYGSVPATVQESAASEAANISIPGVLDGHYLVRCVAGACTQAPGALLLVEPDRVLGTPWLTLTPLPAPWQAPEGARR